MQKDVTLDRTEEAPPVPRKDTPKGNKMDIDGAPASGSKRKRAEQDDTVYDIRDGQLEPADLDAHTPKRSRHSDTEGSESTPVKQQNLRRKKKVNNLSNLNLRHAAEQQRVRESRFQEGSLTDKPSMKPPSAFTRMIRTDSGNIKQMAELMEGYNDHATVPDASVEALVPREEAMSSLNASDEYAPRAEAGAFFRFGRSFAANFHPIALWNKMFQETKEDLIRQSMEEAERKCRQKEEAEARYAQMKAAGQLGLKRVSNKHPDIRGSEESARPRDSAVVLDGAYPTNDHKRTTSTGSQLLPPRRDDISSHSGSEVPESSKLKGTFRSRFAFKKPSVSNLKDGLKRVKSNLDLSAAAAGANRESSSSVSPVKAGFDTMKRSASKFDLKKQQKLSKRVSDLESKLQLARRELGEALTEASPMPKLNNKCERFTPQSTLKRPKFIPGKLPSLPSERVLMAEQLGFGDDEASPNQPAFDAQLSKALNLSERMDIDGDATIKARGSRQYPTRADALFKLSNGNIDILPHADQKIANTDKAETSDLTQLTSDSANMDPNSITNFTSDGAPESTNTKDCALLDSKLKALDKQVKATKKPATKSKKRKSGANHDDKPFRPTNETDDDDDWQEANGTPRKKRESIGKSDGSPPSQAKRARVNAGKQSSPKGRKAANGAAKTGKATTKKQSPQKTGKSIGDQYSQDEESDAEAGADGFDELPVRTSLDSQGQPLQPLYEEEEDTITVPLNEDPSEPTAKATPARYFGARSRSGSPHKRTGSVQPAAEETMLTRAAEAAKGRRGRSASPAPNGHSKIVETVKETVTVEPGEGDAPSLPNDVNGSFQKLTQPAEEVLKTVTTKTTVEMKRRANEAFEWPEDVF